MRNKFYAIIKKIFIYFLALSVIGCNLQTPNLFNDKKLVNVQVTVPNLPNNMQVIIPGKEKLQQINDLPKNNNKFSIKGITRYEEDSSSISFGGTWDTITDPNASGGSYKMNNGLNSLIDEQDVNTAYTGTWTTVANTSAHGGSFALNDGQAASIIENNSGSLTYSGGWTTANTSNASGGNFSYNFGYHIPVEENSASVNYNGNGWSNNGSIGGKNFSFTDSYQGMTNIAHNDPSVTYNGSWSDMSSYHTSDGTSGQSFDVNFTGTNISAYCLGGTDKGIVSVKLYNSLNFIIKQYDLDLYNTSVTGKLIIFTGLSKGNYRLNVSPKGTNNPSSSGMNFDFWKAYVFPSIEYTFYGNQIRYYATKYSRGGKVYVTVDGNNSTTSLIDLYAAPSGQYPYGYVSLAKEYTNLTPGKHKITIDGTPWFSDPGKSYNVINLERFDVMPYVQGTFLSSTLILNTVSAPGYGKMDLYIDDMFNRTIDLYSPTARYNNFTTEQGLPTDRSHTFTLVGRRDKNPSSTGYIINLDNAGNGIPTVTKSFNGVDQTLYSMKGPDQGMVNLMIDGQMIDGDPTQAGVNPIDLYSPTYKHNEPIAKVSFGSTPGNHTIGLVQSFTNNSLSKGYKFSLDSTGTGASSGMITFTGTTITLYLKKGPDMGALYLGIDGTAKTPIDLYSPTSTFASVNYSGLSQATHYLYFYSELAKNDLSTGYVITLDAYDIDNPSQPSITSFNPPSAGYGETFTVNGSQFSKLLSENTVKLNGTTLEIINLIDLNTADEFSDGIVVRLPAGATNGKIVVTTTKGGSVTSQDEFVVNNEPFASFNIDHNSATSTSTVFNVDASSSTDIENGSNIQVKWNWGDGTIADFSGVKTANHTYSTEGYKTIMLTVKDNNSIAPREAYETKTIFIGPAGPGTWETSISGIGGNPRAYGGIAHVNGKIYFLGGYGNYGVTTDVDEFDPINNLWYDPADGNFAASLPISTVGVPALEFNGQILMFLDKLYLFDPPDFANAYYGAWTNQGTPSVYTYSSTDTTLGSAMVIINNKLYIAGGTQSGAGDPASQRFSSYDLISKTWDTTLPQLPQAFKYGAYGVINGKIYLVSGIKGFLTLDLGSKVMIFDPVTKTWKYGTDVYLPTYEDDNPAQLDPYGTPFRYSLRPRHSAASGVINGKLYIAGGKGKVHTGSSTTAEKILDSTMIYDPSTDDLLTPDVEEGTWITGPRIPQNVSQNIQGQSSTQGVVFADQFYLISGTRNHYDNLTGRILRLRP